MDVVRYLLGKYMGTYKKNHYDMDKRVEQSHRNNYYNMDKHTGQYRKNRCKVPKYMGQYRKLNKHPL